MVANSKFLGNALFYSLFFTPFANFTAEVFKSEFETSELGFSKPGWKQVNLLFKTRFEIKVHTDSHI